MKRAVWAALRQAFCGYGFAAGVLGTAAVLLAASFEGVLEAYRAGELAPAGHAAALLIRAVSSDAMALSLPLLCTLPYTASFLDDVKSGFIKAYLPRTSVSRYIAGKAAACALSGGMALSGGALCGLLALWLVLLPRTARTGAAEGQGAELAALLLMLLFCGALWALVGMTLSALTDSRYIAYASPFVLFYLLVILYERYYDGLFVLYPREWLDPSPRWVYGRAGVAVLLAELGALAALAFARAARRRLARL